MSFYVLEIILSFVVLGAFLMVFYKLGKRVRLRRDYQPVGINLFVGGGLGGILGAYVIPDMVDRVLCAIGVFRMCQWVGSYLGALLVLGYVWVWDGLGVMFSAFFAIALANFKRTKTKRSVG